MSGYPPQGSPSQPPHPYAPQEQYSADPNQQLPPIQPPGSGGKKLGCILITLLCIGLSAIACCGGFIYWIGTMSNDVSNAVAETKEQKQERFVAGFEVDPEIDQHPDFQDVQALLEQLQTSSETGDSSDLIDVDLLYREMIATKKMRPRPFGTRIFMSSIIEEAEIVRPFTEFRIASIDSANGQKDEAIVLLHLSDASSSWREELYVVRKSGGWKIYDWSEIGTDVRASLELAVINGDNSTSRYTEYNRFYTNIEKSNNSVDVAESEKLLKQINPDRIYPELRNSMWALLSSYWIGLGNIDQALNCLDRLPDQQTPPDALLYRAMCASQKSDYAECVDLLDQYEQITGNSINAKLRRAEAYQSLDDTPKVADEYIAILKIMPDHGCIDSLARYTVGSAGFEHLTTAIMATNDPLERAERIGDAFHSYQSHEGVQRLAQLSEELNPQSATATFLSGLTCDLEGDLQQAAKLIQKARSMATEQVATERYEYSLTDIYLREDQMLKYYQEADDKVTAFEEVYWYWADDMLIDARTMTEIAELHLKTEPESRDARQLLIQQSLANKDYAEVIAACRDKESAEYNIWLLAEAYVKSGKELDGLRDSKLFEGLFTQISRLLREKKEYERLSKLMERYGDRVRPEEIKSAGILTGKEGWQSLYSSALLNAAAILKHNNHEHEAAWLLLNVDAKEDSENSWMLNSIVVECINIIVEAGDKADDWLVFDNDGFKIKEPGTFRFSNSSIDWNDFDSAFYRFFWEEDYESAAALLRQFEKWKKTRSEWTLLRARLLNETNRSEEAEDLLSDAWLAKVKAMDANGKGSSSLSSYELMYPGEQSVLENAYTLTAKTARLNGDYRRAMKYAEILEKDFKNSTPKLQVACVSGDVKLVEQTLKSNTVGIWSLRYEPDVAAAFSSPKFDEIRKAEPDTWNTQRFDSHSVLLFDKPVSVDLDKAREFIESRFKSVRLLSDKKLIDDRADQSLLFQSDALHFRISIGTKPLKLVLPQVMPVDDSKLLSNHKAWIAIEIATDRAHPDYDDQIATTSRREIEKHFQPLAPAAVLRDWQAIMDPDDIESFFEPNFQLNKINELESVHEASIDVDTTAKRLKPAQVAELNKAALALNENEHGKLSLEVAIDSIGRTESSVVRVYKIKPGYYGHLRFLVELVDDQPSIQFRRGRKKYFEVGYGAITGWTVDK